MAPAGGAEGGEQMSTLSMILPWILIFVVFYFLLIRPQQKRAKEHKDMLGGIKKGDSVLTQGGIYGKVVATEENVLILEIADKVKVKVARGYIAGLAAPGAEQTPQGA
jgi:preprotein translocase subunit YajC